MKKQCYISLLGLSFFLLGATSSAQQAVWDSLNIQYRLVNSYYNQDKNVFKIKVPPYLNTREVMRQVRLVVQWPGDPPPKKKTVVYVFKEDVPENATSKTGGVFIPGKGFLWDMRDWQPDTSILHYRPRPEDKFIYNTLLDSLFAHQEFSDLNAKEVKPIKQNVARRFSISLAELDSIFYRVKWWLNLHKHDRSDNP